MSCKILHVDLQLAIQLEKCNKQHSFDINSRYIPAALLKIQQTWQGKSYQFNPSFRGRLIPLKHTSWQSTPNFFLILIRHASSMVLRARVRTDFSRSKNRHSRLIVPRETDE